MWHIIPQELVIPFHKNACIKIDDEIEFLLKGLYIVLVLAVLLSIPVPNPSPKSKSQIQVPNPSPKSKIQSPEEGDWGMTSMTFYD